MLIFMPAYYLFEPFLENELDLPWCYLWEQEAYSWAWWLKGLYIRQEA